MAHYGGMTDFIDFKTLKRPPKPNTCLVAPEGFCEAASADFVPPVFNMDCGALFDRLIAHIRSQTRWSNLLTDSSAWRLRCIAATPWLRFKDDIDIQLIPVNTKTTTLAVYSRSRVGYSDLGANRKRVEALIASLTKP